MPRGLNSVLLFCLTLAFGQGQAFAHDGTDDGHQDNAAGFVAGDALVYQHVVEPGTPQTLKLRENAPIRLEISGAPEGELHLHGYDVLANPTQDGTAVFEFRADLTGRFAIVSHDADDLLGREEKAIMYIEVHPE